MVTDTIIRKMSKNVLQIRFISTLNEVPSKKANLLKFPKFIIVQLLVAIVKLLVPFFLGIFIDWFAGDVVSWNFFENPKYDGYMYALFFGLASIFNSLIGAAALHDLMIEGEVYHFHQ